MNIHPIRFTKMIIIKILTKILCKKFSIKNIRYVGPLLINKRIYNYIASSDSSFGYIEILGNLWIYS
jgi:hypothetical protein